MKHSVSVDILAKDSVELQDPDKRSEAIERILMESDEHVCTSLFGPMNIDPRSTYLDGNEAVEEVIFNDDDPLNGTMWVSFEHDVYYGCKDADRVDDDQVEVKFRVSLEDKSISFSVYQPDERDPDEF